MYGRVLNVKKLHPVSQHFLYVAGASNDKQVLNIVRRSPVADDVGRPVRWSIRERYWSFESLSKCSREKSKNSIISALIQSRKEVFAEAEEEEEESTRVGTLIVATIYLQLIQNRYMFRSFTVIQCSHQHCVQPVASDVEVVGYL